MRFAIAIVLIAWHSFGALATINSIGKERKPISNSTAIVAVVMVAGIVAGIVVLYR